MNLKKLISAYIFFLPLLLSAQAFQWHVGTEISPSYVVATNSFVKGENGLDKRIATSLSGSIRGGFSFSPNSREGRLYKGLYQGLGFDAQSLFAKPLLGTPVSVYVYQGAPIFRLGKDLSLGYEWEFGAAFGWKHSNEETSGNNYPVSTAVTARMGLALKMNYSLSDYWKLSFGIRGTHYSNGNTSYPNSGINTIGASVGVAYVINPQKETAETQAEADDTPDWYYDIMAYGAWRKRAVEVNGSPQMCPGAFGVAGLQFSVLRALNRYVAVGPALDVQYNESLSLEQYWVEGSYDDDIKFYRPPFGKQIKMGLAAQAELTMPIFSINAGLGFDIISPKGDKRFYQSLTLKTFVHRNVYLNVGYRLGNFNEPQNLMLGVGVRLY